MLVCCIQAPKLIRQLSTDPRLDAGIKSEAQQVLKIVFSICFGLKYTSANLSLIKWNTGSNSVFWNIFQDLEDVRIEIWHLQWSYNLLSIVLITFGDFKSALLNVLWEWRRPSLALLSDSPNHKRMLWDLINSSEPIMSNKIVLNSCWN